MTTSWNCGEIIHQEIAKAALTQLTDSDCHCHLCHHGHGPQVESSFSSMRMLVDLFDSVQTVKYHLMAKRMTAVEYSRARRPDINFSAKSGFRPKPKVIFISGVGPKTGLCQLFTSCFKSCNKCPECHQCTQESRENWEKKHIGP